MNLYRRREPQAQDNSMIPLINVVFLMLAFFMMAGRSNARMRSAWTHRNP